MPTEDDVCACERLILDMCCCLSGQVALRWVNQQGVLLATSPGENVDFMLADLDLQSFSLTDEEMEALRAIEPTLTPPAQDINIDGCG